MAVIQSFVTGNSGGGKTSTKLKGSMPDVSYYIKRAAPIVQSMQRQRTQQQQTQTRQSNFDNSKTNAEKFAQEAQQANSFTGIAKNTLGGLNPFNQDNAYKTLGKEVISHPLDTAQSAVSGVYKGGVAPLLKLASYLMPGVNNSVLAPGIRENIDRVGQAISPKNPNDVQQSIGGGFNMAGTVVGPYKVAGEAVSLLSKTPQVAKLLPYLAKSKNLQELLGFIGGGQISTDAKDVQGRLQQAGTDTALFGAGKVAGGIVNSFKSRVGVPQVNTIDTTVGKTNQVPEKPTINGLKTNAQDVSVRNANLQNTQPLVSDIRPYDSTNTKPAGMQPTYGQLDLSGNVTGDVKNIKVTGGQGSEHSIPILKQDFATRMAKSGKEVNITDKQGNLVPGELQKAIDYALTNAKDKIRLNYHNQTPERNIEDIFGPHASIVKQYLSESAAKNETSRMKWYDSQVKEIGGAFDQLGLKLKNAEDKLAFQYAEKTLSLKDLQKQAPSTWKNIVSAADLGRQKYNTYLDQINAKLAQYGYDSIPKRADYVTHTNELSIFDNMFGGLTNIAKEKIPAVMQMIHMQTKPGKEFFKYGLKRKGGAFEESLINAMDAYLTPASNQIFHTDTAQAARTFEKVLKAQLERNPQGQQLGNFTSWVTDYINGLTGKGSDLDRSVEKLIGRQLPASIAWLRSRTSANMVGGNISSALTNLIPLTQSIATTEKLSAGKGLIESFNTPFSKTPNLIDGVESAFLTRRYGGANRIKTTLGDAISKKFGWLFSAIDKFTSHSVVSGKYYEGIANGLSPQKAMASADQYGARILADRSFGQLPTLFNSKTAGLITQFQLEVNNQVSFLLKDIPKMAGGNKLKLASMLGQVTLYSYIYNNLFENATGRRPAVDPIGLIQKTTGDFQSGNDKKWQNLVGNVSNQLPYASTFTGGGRIPLNAASPDFTKLASGDILGGFKGPLSYVLPPSGGGQAKKTLEGLQTYNQGYSAMPSGDVRTPVEQNTPNLLRSVLFGQYSTPEVRSFYNNNKQPLGGNAADLFKQLPQNERQSYYDQKMQQRTLDARATEIHKQQKDLILQGIMGGKSDLIKQGVALDPKWAKDNFTSLMKEGKDTRSPSDKALLEQLQFNKKLTNPFYR